MHVNNEQIIAIVALPGICILMYPVFRLLGNKYGKILWNGKNPAWYLGILTYWIIWCVVFPIVLIGWSRIVVVFELKQIGIISLLISIFPIVFTFIGRFILKFEQVSNNKEQIFIATTAIIMGIVEEVLWRGLFIVIFPGDYLWGFIWPSVWFAIWHLDPGSISILNKWTLALGALIFGLCWGFVAMQTNSIFWTVISHVSVGLVRIINIQEKERPTTNST